MGIDLGQGESPTTFHLAVASQNADLGIERTAALRSRLGFEISVHLCIGHNMEIPCAGFASGPDPHPTYA